jgi:hypothetical protein
MGRMEKNKTRGEFRIQRIIIIPLVFLLYYLASFLVEPYAAFWGHYFDRSIWSLLMEWSAALLCCILITETSIFISRYLNKTLPWDKQSLKRLLIQFFIQIAFVMAFILLLNLLDLYLTENYKMDQEDIKNIGQLTIISILISLLISSVHTGSFLLSSWKKSAIEASELKLKAAHFQQTAMQSELQALKMQLDPHFLFNNFSVLTDLIMEDQVLAVDFLDNLSKIYRYLMMNSNKNLIPLNQEIKFIRSYIFLIRIRHGESVHFEMDISEHALEKGIPPLTLQLLIENALKHNQTLKSNPLKISIRSKSDYELEVSNDLLPIENQAPSLGMGLKNIYDRYRILTDKAPLVEQAMHRFCVHLPLIELEQ